MERAVEKPDYNAFSEAKWVDTFEEFLSLNRKYLERISLVPYNNSTSLVVDYEDILKFSAADIAMRLILQPIILDYFNAAFQKRLEVVDPVYAERVRGQLTVRIAGIEDLISLRKVSNSHLQQLIAVKAIVVKASAVNPFVRVAVYLCSNKHANLELQDKSWFIQRFEGPCTGGNGNCQAQKFRLSKKMSQFADYQILTIQELPEDLPPGQLPQRFEVVLTGDMCNSARPGDRINLTAIVEAEAAEAEPRTQNFRFKLVCNYIELLSKKPDDSRLSSEDIDHITSIAKLPGAWHRLVISIAPAIFGNELYKEGVLLTLVGAPRRILEDGTAMRGDINCLFVGDAGLAKSELLKCAAKIAPRGLFTTGKGSSGCGLTASVLKDKNGLMTLEAGAVVLADQGLAVIDEFGRMKEEDVDALHEAMEQNTVSVAKAGITATLNARTSILAAENPRFGKYDPFKTLLENVNLPIPLLSVGPTEQILIRSNGEIKSRAIGAFVDQFYSRDDQGFPVFVGGNLETVCMDENYNLIWKPLKYVFRHTPEGKHYKVTFKGRDLILSGGHSVYTVSDGRIVARPTQELQVGDFVVISKKLPPNGQSLLSEIELLPYLSLDDLFLHGVPGNVFARLGDSVPYHHRIKSRLPASRHNELSKEEISLTTISKQGSGFYIPNRIPVDADLMRLLGYFVAEGSLIFLPTEGVYVVDFSLNSETTKDANILSDICKISERLFHVKPCLTRSKRAKCIKVGIRSRVVAEFLRNCFGLKSGAREKRIPDIVFNASDECRAQFLTAYYDGDAGVTSSRELASQLLQLHAQDGNIGSIFYTKPNTTKMKDGHEIHGNGSWFVPLPKHTGINNNMQTHFPLDELQKALAPLLAFYNANTKQVRKVVTPKYWERLLHVQQTRLSKLRYFQQKNPATAKELAAQFEIKCGTGDTLFVKQMVDRGLLFRITNSGKGRHYSYNLTRNGESVLETVDIVDKVLVGDLAFAKIENIKELGSSDLPNFVYDLSIPGAENFVADTAICHNTRFDLIFIITDTPNRADDKALTAHISSLYQKGKFTQAPPIDSDLLKKYIAYARQTDPRLTDESIKPLVDYYLEMRATSDPDSMAVTPRWFTGLIRLATARARALLHKEVLLEDSDNAVRIMRKMLQVAATDPTTKKIDVGLLSGNPTHGDKQIMTGALDLIKSMRKDSPDGVRDEDFKAAMLAKNIVTSTTDAQKFFERMYRAGLIYENRQHFFLPI